MTSESCTSVDKSGDRVRRMFGQIAARYDRMNHLLSCNVDKYWRWRATRLVRASGSGPILDLCTGTGDLALAYYRSTRGRLPIVAADFCQEMLEIGARKSQKLAKPDRIVFVEADAQNLPFADDQFQITCVAFGLRNVADTDRGLTEMVRVTRPAGKVAILEFSQPSLPPFRWFYGLYFRHVLPRVGQWLARNDAAAYGYLPESVGQFPTGATLAERLRGNGLREVWFRPLTLGIATLYVGTK